MTVVLVTGAAGVIGSRLVRALLDHRPPPEVIALDVRDPQAATGSDRVSWVRASVGGPFSAAHRDALAAVTHLAHLAARMSVTVAPSDRWTALADPVRELRRLLTHLPALRHVVFASSYMVYATPPRNPVTEDRPLGPLNQYAWGKAAIEAYLADLPVPSCSLRLAGVYGPGVPLNLGRSVTEVLRALVDGDTITLHRPGTSLRNHLFITDAVAALHRAVTAQWRGVYNIAGPDPVSVRDVVKVCEQVAGRPVPARWVDGDRTWDAIIATDRVSRRYGFRPGTGIRTGMRTYLEWATSERDG